MKSNVSSIGGAVCLSFLVMAPVAVLRADQAAPAPKSEKSFTGLIVNIDPREHTLKTKDMFFHKQFNLGDGCTYLLPDNNAGTISDLRPGEKIQVEYQDVNGVLVADRIEQKLMHFEGVVKAIDPMSRTLTVHRPTFDKDLQIAGECKVMLPNDQPGKLTDIQTGEHVTVTYESPEDATAVARQIVETGESFTGSVVALDLSARTVKARGTFHTKKFNLADDCVIVTNGKLDGRLDDLKPDEKLMFTYDEVKGVNVVTRIGPAPEPPVNSAMTSQPGSSY